MAKEHARGTSIPWKRRLAIVGLALGPRGRWIVGPVLVLLFLWGGLRLAWQSWGDDAARGSDYVVSAESIHVTPQPAWIHGDVRSDVVKSAGLEGLSIRDPQLVEQVQRAFSLHGWIARVLSVRKEYPARITVEVEYRHPVAMVEVVWKGEPSLYFIDKDSVLLPKDDHERSQDERQSEYQNYLRIAAGELSPGSRIAGQPWGGAKIAGAARLAALGGEQWQKLGVCRVVVSDDLNAQPLYELETASAGRIVWGHAPGAEDSREPTAEAKWKWLMRFVAQHGPLDKAAREQRLDLRTLSRGPERSAANPNDAHWR